MDDIPNIEDHPEFGTVLDEIERYGPKFNW